MLFPERKAKMTTPSTKPGIGKTFPVMICTVPSISFIELDLLISLGIAYASNVLGKIMWRCSLQNELSLQVWVLRAGIHGRVVVLQWCAAHAWFLVHFGSLSINGS
jgi:hypothetical protein